MSALPSQTRAGRLWRRSWFHLGLVLVLLPLIYLKPYLDLQAMFLGEAEEDAREVSVDLGPWTAMLQERGAEKPFWAPRDGFVKEFRILPCRQCVAQIRSLSIGLKRAAAPPYGEEFEGNPYRAFARMKVDPEASPDGNLWITAEGWDGSLHRASLPIARASPVTAKWLAARSAGR